MHLYIYILLDYYISILVCYYIFARNPTAKEDCILLYSYVILIYPH